jgi:CopA family copper-resistance protein
MPVRNPMSKPILTAAAVFVILALEVSVSLARTYDLVIDETTVNLTGRQRPALAVNGSIPAPTLRFTEGEDVVINVTNKLEVDASIHWHGFILPYRMDGVPGISFPGIRPGETFTYRFKIVQNGTYWYHSHSGLQEQAGVYGAIVIEPAKKDPVTYDRDYVVLLSDWTDERPESVLSNLKKQSDYYNYNKRTVFDFFRDVREEGWDGALEDRLMWGRMRMDPTDIADVTGYTFLLNGQPPQKNWTALFKAGERVRLRFVNGSAMSYFDVRIPGLEMTVVAADGQNTQSVPVDRFRVAVAETYDIIVEPKAGRAYTILAEVMDKSGYARGTLAPRPGMEAAIPKLGERPMLTMADMGPGQDGNGHAGMSETPDGGMAGMDHSKMSGSAHGMAMMAADEGPRILQYADLKSLDPYPREAPGREIELKLTGNMERYFWSINGRKYSEAEPIRLRHDERVRIKFVNTTMMNHPMHLHGHWMELDNGTGDLRPRKHVINVKPGETVFFDLTADALGEWAFHCHLLYHMATGMFRKVIVEKQTARLP